MNEVKQLLNEIINENKLIYGILSSRKRKLGNLDKDIKKVTFKFVKLKEEVFVQVQLQSDKQVFHKNLALHTAVNELMNLFSAGFKQSNIFTIENDYQIFINKDMTCKILRKKATKKTGSLEHNREKKYILQDNKECAFLYKLGIMNKQGKVLSKKFDKFKQLNRFLELVEDCLENINNDKEFVIIDFGCGKSYLTFALYHYLVEIRKMNVRIIGLDLKKDVIEFCNKTARELSYDKLEFIHGDIKGYNEVDKVDMVITLHACDTATDDALVKAVNWGADIILSVPCCQHELFGKIHNPIMESMEKYGIIKERMASLITDSLRANVLEIVGYSTQIVEFINMEHTPKNLMIRAVKNDKLDNSKSIKAYKDLVSFWNIKPYIEDAMGERLQKNI
ncbi:class I SAM-dependent methyltransferase [Abyssisolibacter fermentans]|uniref:class I SAM-dependent methyltransferase n=1 Tax=Abyssisolibacter fermentans TaxID=1766203 RepID=UPI00082D68D5|nr:SAM-dependent methyltransferase [Abyssisolibacter fermentans]